MTTKLSSTKINGVVRGIVAGVSANGEAEVDFVSNTTGAPIPALATVLVSRSDIGREAVLMFEDGDAARPILMGFVGAAARQAAVQIDGDRMVLSAEREIVLQCGESSITLTRAGKVLIRGKYVLSNSTGVNMVKGGVIRLN
jgi:hypothetical protein